MGHSEGGDTAKADTGKQIRMLILEIFIKNDNIAWYNYIIIADSTFDRLCFLVHGAALRRGGHHGFCPDCRSIRCGQGRSHPALCKINTHESVGTLHVRRTGMDDYLWSKTFNILTECTVDSSTHSWARCWSHSVLTKWQGKEETALNAIPLRPRPL